MKFTRLTTSEELLALLKFHEANSEFVVIDVETTSVNPREAKLIDVQLSGRNEDEAVIFGPEIAPLLTNFSKTCVIVGHNYKYDAQVLFNHGIDLLSHTWRDTMLIAHLLDENRDSYSLDSLVKEFYNDNYKEEFWAKYKSYEEAPEEERIEYACKDIVYTGRLFRSFSKRLHAAIIPDSLVAHVHKLQGSLLRTEIAGIKVDLKYLEELGVRIKHRIDELGPEMRGMVADEIRLIELESWQKEIDKMKTDRGKAGVKRPEFSFESTQQLQRLLYGKLNLPVQKNEKTKSVSTDSASLERLKEAHPVVGLIQENRELQKVYSAYITGTLERVEYDRESTPRIYPQFRVNGTATGRISHNSPNMAQLPKSGGVRAIYVPDSGRRFISADYSQLEVIVEANLTGCKNLIRMLENGESKHDVTARELGCSRDTAKTLNFALQYWCTAGKVAKLLGVSSAEGNNIYNRYWEVYSGAKRLKAKTDRMVDEGIPLVTLFGRKRRFAKRKRNMYDGDYRQAFNFLIQGTGADCTHEAFYNIAEWLSQVKLGRALFEVHDEIIIEALTDHCEEAQDKLIQFMVGVGERIGFNTPLKAVGSGPTERWED